MSDASLLAGADNRLVEIAELVLAYVEAVVWPAVTVAIVWGLRGHIRRALARMTRLETPIGAIELEADLRELRDRAEEAEAGDAAHPITGEGEGEAEPAEPAPEPEPDSARSKPGEPGFITDQFNDARRMVDVSPVGAVVTAWNALMAECQEALVRRDVLVDERRPYEVIKQVERLGLSENVRQVFHELRQLRNRAVHNIGDSLTPGAAYDFVASSRVVARKVNEL